MKASRRRLAAALGTLLWTTGLGALPAFSQRITTGKDDVLTIPQMEKKIDALSATLDQTRAELTESRDEIRQMRSLLENVNRKLDLTTEAQPGASLVSSQASPEGQIAEANPAAEDPGVQRQAKITEDDWEVLNSRLEQERQVKVESGSRFPLKLSGMLLFDTIVNSGSVDNFDLPTEAVPSATPHGGTGFSVRQSVIGIEGNGPRVAGAETSADIQADFYGGTPTAYGSANAGLARLRLARARFDWAHTSIIGGIDTPFFSPNSPTSYLTVAEPGFAAAGNLWTWAPQIRVEDRIDTSMTLFRAEAGVLDSASVAPSLSGNRFPSPSEMSKQPIYAVRLSANGRNPDRPAAVGISGVFVTQHFFGGSTSHQASGSADWNLPIGGRISLTGEAFLGKGLDSFGGAPAPVLTTQNYIQYIATSAPHLANLGIYGGWTQLKFRVNSRTEFNLALGGAARDAAAFRFSAATDSLVEALALKNESLTVNYIYRPRSDLLFSAEYRRLRTYQISGATATNGETGLSAGFLF